MTFLHAAEATALAALMACTTLCRLEQTSKQLPDAGDNTASPHLRLRSQHLPDAEQRHLIPSAPGQSAGASTGNEAAEKQPNLAQCLLDLDYWLMSSSFLMIMGAGFTLLNNLGLHNWTLPA